MARSKYPLSIKQSMVARYLRDSDSGIGEFSRDNGIPESSLRDWIREAESGILDSMNKPKHFKYWTLSEKFSAILEFESLSDEEQGKWLRKHGLKLDRIHLWKDELQASLDSLNTSGSNPQENKKIKQLEKELKRKDSALAEASALLFAKKKLDAIFGDDTEDK